LRERDWATKSPRLTLRAERQPCNDARCSIHPIVTSPIDSVAILLQTHAAWLGVEPLEPFLTELPLGDPPTASVGFGTQEIFENACLARHGSIGVKCDRDRDAQRGIEVHCSPGNGTLQHVAAKRHRLGVS
jgi:hypothetical protein